MTIGETITREALAKAVGVTPQHISRLAGQGAFEGIIEQRAHGSRVRHFPALATPALVEWVKGQRDLSEGKRAFAISKRHHGSRNVREAYAIGDMARKMGAALLELKRTGRFARMDGHELYRLERQMRPALLVYCEIRDRMKASGIEPARM